MHGLWQEIRAVDTSRKALRSFGLVVGGVFVGIAAIIVWRSGWALTPVAQWLGGPGAVLIVLGLVAPPLLRPLYRVWMGLALVLGFVMTRVLLTLVYYLLLTPIGLLLRLFGKDPMHRHPDPEASSYWIPKEYLNEGPERLEKYY